MPLELPQGQGDVPRRSIRRVRRLTPVGCMRRASVCGVPPSGPPGSLRFATSVLWGKATAVGACSDAPAACRRWPVGPTRGQGASQRRAEGFQGEHSRSRTPAIGEADPSGARPRRSCRRGRSPGLGGAGGMESSPARWRDGQRQDGSVGQPQPATRGRPQRTHPPPTESAGWRGAASGSREHSGNLNPRRGDRKALAHKWRYPAGRRPGRGSCMNTRTPPRPRPTRGAPGR